MVSPSRPMRYTGREWLNAPSSRARARPGTTSVAMRPDHSLRCAARIRPVWSSNRTNRARASAPARASSAATRPRPRVSSSAASLAKREASVSRLWRDSVTSAAWRFQYALARDRVMLASSRIRSPADKAQRREYPPDILMGAVAGSGIRPIRSGYQVVLRAVPSLCPSRPGVRPCAARHLPITGAGIPANRGWQCAAGAPELYSRAGPHVAPP